MLTGLDPHSAYLDQDAFKELQVGTQGEFGGLGIEVGMEDGFVKVVSPIDDTPASRAGIKAGDLIVKLDDTSVKGMTLNDAVKRMRGKPNTQITLTVVRKGETKPLVLTLTRAVIKIQSVKSKLIEPGYAYFRVTQFQEHTGETLAAAIQTLFKQNQAPMRGIILDLRNDPGGLLNGAVAVSAAFLPQNALVVYTDGRTEDAKMRLTASPENYLRGATQGRLHHEAAGRRQERADGGAGQRRFGIGVRNRRRRAAGPQARRHHGHADVRQGLGADHPAARQQHRDQAHDRALLHAERTLDPGQGHHAGHRTRRRHQRQAIPASSCAKPISPSTSKATKTPSRRPPRRRHRRRRAANAFNFVPVPRQKDVPEKDLKPEPGEVVSKNDYELKQAIEFLKSRDTAAKRRAD